MDFTITTSCGPPPWEDALAGAQLLLLPFVWMGLVLWLRRGPRDARDVLGAVAIPRPGRWRRLLGTTGWMFQLALLFVPLQTVMFKSQLWVGNEISHSYCPFCAIQTPREPNLPPFVAMMLVGVGLVLVWLRKRPAHTRDVLRVDARA